MSNKLAVLFVILMVVGVACNPSPTTLAQVTATIAPPLGITSTPTPEPSQTSVPTITDTPTPKPTDTPTTTPTKVIVVENPDPAVPTPLPVNRKMPTGQVNILVLGSDYRPNKGSRTDTVLLVSINTLKDTVSMISIPRDLYVIIPGWTTNRINTAMQHGGFEMMANTFEYNFGVRPDYYVMTNFQGFVGLVDSLGGINVNVGKYLSDICDLPQKSKGYCTVRPATVKMNGKTALWYVRSRYSTSDFDRLRRSQEVVQAIFTKIISLDGLQKVPELYNQYKSSIETNMNLSDLLNLAPVAAQVTNDPALIKNFTFTSGVEATSFTNKNGADVQLPNFEAIDQLFDEAIFSR